MRGCRRLRRPAESPSRESWDDAHSNQRARVEKGGVLPNHGILPSQEALARPCRSERPNGLSSVLSWFRLPRRFRASVDRVYPEFQFGLRKLFLWTTVVALYLGLLQMLDLRPLESLFLLWWVLAVGCVGTASRVVAVVFSAIVGLMIVKCFLQPRLTPTGVLMGLSLAFVVFGFAECAFRAVDLTDDLMGTKGDEKTRRD